MEFLSGIGAAVAAITCRSVTELGTKSAARVVDSRVIFTLHWMVPALLLSPITIILIPWPSVTIQGDFWWILSVDAPLTVLGSYLFIRSFQLSDASLVAPFSLLTPILLLGTSCLMLGESIPPLGIVGVLAVLVGSYQVARTAPGEFRGTGYRTLLKDAGVRSMTGAAVIWSVTSNLDKMGVAASSPLVWSVAISWTMFAAGLLMLLTLRADKMTSQVWRAVIPGIASTGTIVFQMWALTILPVAYVITLKRFSTIITVVAAKVMFGEEVGGRLLGSSIAFLGVLVVVLQLYLAR